MVIQPASASDSSIASLPDPFPAYEIGACPCPYPSAEKGKGKEKSSAKGKGRVASWRVSRLGLGSDRGADTACCMVSLRLARCRTVRRSLARTAFPTASPRAADGCHGNGQPLRRRERERPSSF